ncbi:MAG TPA: hypothetical protein VFI25_09275 [Planctomycetota bacterium]|jgi:uncharacterized protein (DUF1697 family)|nr:hypothetical protein [Planctomycetota bacterium]
MTLAAFVRGVNVGGHKVFRPKALAEELSGVVSVGAAGTFVVRGAIAAGALRAEIGPRLPAGAEVMIRPGREVLDLVSREPFPPEASLTRDRRFVSVLGARPRKRPPFPLRAPAGSGWQVLVVGLQGAFVYGLWRPAKRSMVYPNEVVERELGVPATTRAWDTILKVAALLRGGDEGTDDGPLRGRGASPGEPRAARTRTARRDRRRSRGLRA